MVINICISNNINNFLFILSSVFLIILGLILFWLYFPGQFHLLGWLLVVLIFIAAAKLWLGLYSRYGHKVILVTALIAVLVYAAYTWYGAYEWAGRVQADEFGWYHYPELSRMEIKNTYDLAFEKIVLIAGFVFGGLTVLFKVTKH